MRQCACLFVLVLFLLPGLAAADSAPAAPSLQAFLSSLPAPEAGAAPAPGVPEPRWMGTNCLAAYQSCLAGCAGNSACELLCQCDYYECRGFDAPTFCL